MSAVRSGSIQCLAARVRCSVAATNGHANGHGGDAHVRNLIRRFVEVLLPSYERDNRSYLTVAIGCTGGRHRSVYLAERLALAFGAEARVLVRHRGLAAAAGG